MTTKSSWLTIESIGIITLTVISYFVGREIGSRRNYNNIVSPVRISDDQVIINSDTISIQGLSNDITVTTVEDTKSMLPTLSKGMKIILEGVNNYYDLKVNDIIMYESPVKLNDIYIHRIIEISADSDGRYYITKGDNNFSPDPYKVRETNVLALYRGSIL